MQKSVEIDTEKTTSIEYRLPEGMSLSIWVYSNDISTVMLTDEFGRAKYIIGLTPETWIKSSETQHHLVNGIVLPHREKWFLLIENNSEIVITARYGIFICPVER